MRNLIIVYSLALLILVSGCASATRTIGCTAQETLARGVATSMSTYGHCQNFTAVNDWTSHGASYLGLCTMKGYVGDNVCPVLAGVGARELSDQVPAEWQCDPAIVAAGFTAFATKACKLIPFQPNPHIRGVRRTKNSCPGHA